MLLELAVGLRNSKEVLFGMLLTSVVNGRTTLCGKLDEGINKPCGCCVATFLIGAVVFVMTAEVRATEVPDSRMIGAVPVPVGNLLRDLNVEERAPLVGCCPVDIWTTGTDEVGLVLQSWAAVACTEVDEGDIRLEIDTRPWGVTRKGEMTGPPSLIGALLSPAPVTFFWVCADWLISAGFVLN